MTNEEFDAIWDKIKEGYPNAFMIVQDKDLKLYAKATNPIWALGASQYYTDDFLDNNRKLNAATYARAATEGTAS